MALAHSTPIAISANEHKTIEEFQTGDIVYMADKSSGELCWSDAQVKFSAGTGPKSEMVVFIVYGEDQNTLVVTSNQLFLMPTGHMKRTDDLVPREDELVDSTGQSVGTVISLTVGEFQGGIYNISTRIFIAFSVVSGPFGHPHMANGWAALPTARHFVTSSKYFRATALGGGGAAARSHTPC